MEDSKNKNMWIWVVVVLIVVVGLIIWAMGSSTSVPVANNNSVPVAGNNNNNAGVTEVESTEDLSTGSVNVGAPAATIAYGDALIKYKNARLQLDLNCQASPDKMTFKNNATMMIDNRSPLSRTVKVGSVFSIKAYGFKLLKLSSTTLPVTWLVDCGTSQNVSSILIQK